MEIRALTPEDAVAVSEVFAQSWRYAYRGIVNDAYLDALSDGHWTLFLNKNLSDGSVTGLAIGEESGIAGACLIRKSSLSCYPDDGELLAIYLRPEFIEMGAGTRLLAAAEESMRKAGYSHCVLNVLHGNTRALDFYKAHGFEQTEHIEKTVLAGQPLECATMRKEL